MNALFACTWSCAVILCQMHVHRSFRVQTAAAAFAAALILVQALTCCISTSLPDAVPVPVCLTTSAGQAVCQTSLCPAAEICLLRCTGLQPRSVHLADHVVSDVQACGGMPRGARAPARSFFSTEWLPQLPMIKQWDPVAEDFHDAVDHDQVAWGEDGDADGGEGMDEGGWQGDALFFDAPMAFEALHMYGTAAEWLVGVLADADCRQVVQVLEVTNSQEVVMIMPAYDAATHKLGVEALPRVETAHAARVNPFALLRIQLLHFADGLQFCNACANPGCNRSTHEEDCFAHELQYPEQPHRDYNEVFGDCEPLCRCAAAAIAQFWGDTGSYHEATRESSFASWYREQEPFSMSLCHVLFCSLICNDQQPAAEALLRHIQKYTRIIRIAAHLQSCAQELG